MKDIKHLVERVILWNTARYSKQYNHSLAEKLLIEELHELYTAEDWVGILDSVGDIAFVAIGVMWKLGIETSDIVYLFERMQPGKTLVEYNQASDNYIDFVSDKYKFNVVRLLQLRLLCHAMFITSYTMLNSVGMVDKFFDILKAICDSNDTKAIPKQKVAANIKANTNKGEGFIPPTQALTTLLEEVHNGAK